MSEAGDVLLTGASGFVGSHLYPALVAAGFRVRCATRQPEKARASGDGRDWVRLDVADQVSIEEAMRGCSAAFFLVHGMGHGSDYPRREAEWAERFAEAAQRRGIRRVVYLGGVVPAVGKVSRHLGSRQRTGEILRALASTVELRAAMIIGNGSASWTMVRDLAARLPAMILPRWLRNTSYPIFIDDVVVGLIEALRLSSTDSQCLELPGPERITHRDMLNRAAAAMGHDRVMLNVPILSPRLSSYWIALVTRVELSLAQELVEGVRYDLEPMGPSLWEQSAREPTLLDDAIRLALRDGPNERSPSLATLARLKEIGASFREKTRAGA